MPFVVSGLVAAGFAAPLSTADGLLLTITSALSHDLYYRVFRPRASTHPAWSFPNPAAGGGGIGCICRSVETRDHPSIWWPHVFHRRIGVLSGAGPGIFWRATGLALLPACGWPPGFPCTRYHPPSRPHAFPALPLEGTDGTGSESSR